MTLELMAASTWLLSFDNLSIDIDLRFMKFFLVFAPIKFTTRISGESTILWGRDSENQARFQRCSRATSSCTRRVAGGKVFARYMARPRREYVVRQEHYLCENTATM